MNGLPMTFRKRCLVGIIGTLSILALTGCDPFALVGSGGDARLTARPGTPSLTPVRGELVPLGVGSPRDGVLYVPNSYSADRPMPLFVALHGAGGTGRYWEGYVARAEELGFILLAPDSRRGTWDQVSKEFGPDVRFLDEALRKVFDQCRVDPSRIALGGFSDGASYALSMGVVNGDLFTHLVAYSPGYYEPGKPRTGRPRIFVSHGRGDPILPYSYTSDHVVPDLMKSGYDVEFEWFFGGHIVPNETSRHVLDWFMGGSG
jgi:phospholipase/carboxylesterase